MYSMMCTLICNFYEQPEQHHHHINKERTQHPDQTPVNQWSRQQPNYTDSAQQGNVTANAMPLANGVVY